MFDRIIALQLLALEARHLRVGIHDRGVLRQIPVDHQFAAIRRGKELLRHKLHAEQGEEEGCNGHADSNPAMIMQMRSRRENICASRPFCS